LGNVLGLCVCGVLANRKYPGLLRTLGFCLAGFAVLIAPWLCYAQPWHQWQGMEPQHLGRNILYYSSEIHFHIMPLALLLLPVITYAFRRRRDLLRAEKSAVKETEKFLWALIPSQLFVLSMAPGYYFRYITPLIPVLTLLGAAIVVNYIKWRMVRYLLITIRCISNVLAVFSGYPVRGSHRIKMPFVEFICEITSSYTDRLEDVVSYLRQNAHSDESVLVPDPEFPLIFYTNMRIIDAKFSRVVTPLDLPDWIFTESASGLISRASMRLPKALLENYEMVLLTVHDTPRQGSRPAPDMHTCFTSSKLTQMVIYKKVR